VNAMKIKYKKVLGITILIFISIFIVVGIAISIAALQEKPPEHPLDFQDIKKVELAKPIKSVEDGLPFALKRANEWRKDVVLTGIQIVSEGKEQIENRIGIINYTFEFEYVNEKKPGGILIVSINTQSNSIELVSASHDGEDKSRKVKKLEFSKMAESINKIYDTAIKAIGKDNIFQFKQPFVRVSINLNNAVFESGTSETKLPVIKSNVRIDMSTFK
jgi:hypothetical protein